MDAKAGRAARRTLCPMKTHCLLAAIWPGFLLTLQHACAAGTPTFSDARRISINPGGIPGADSAVRAAVVDASSNLYIGGDFIVAGGVVANRIAKWNGSNWSALNSGLGGAGGDYGLSVYALAVSGNDLYAGGNFTTAGKVSATNVDPLEPTPNWVWYKPQH